MIMICCILIISNIQRQKINNMVIDNVEEIQYRLQWQTLLSFDVHVLRAYDMMLQDGMWHHTLTGGQIMDLILHDTNASFKHLLYFVLLSSVQERQFLAKRYSAVSSQKKCHIQSIIKHNAVYQCIQQRLVAATVFHPINTRRNGRCRVSWLRWTTFFSDIWWFFLALRLFDMDVRPPRNLIMTYHWLFNKMWVATLSGDCGTQPKRLHFPKIQQGCRQSTRSRQTHVWLIQQNTEQPTRKIYYKCI